MNNAQKLEALNAYRAAEGLAPFAAWKVARHQPMLDAYQKAEFEASEAELAKQTIRATEEPTPVAQPEPVAAAKADKPAKAEKAPKVVSEKVNGIAFPRAGGLCFQAWVLFDQLRQEHGEFTIKQALAEGYKRNLNDNNIRTELCRWRKYNGIAARAPKEA